MGLKDIFWQERHNLLPDIEETLRSECFDFGGMTMVRYKNEKTLIIEQLWAIIMRSLPEEDKDDAGCGDWFTVGHRTYISHMGWLLSEDPEIARLVNAIHSLEGQTEFIFKTEEEVPENFRYEEVS